MEIAQQQFGTLDANHLFQIIADVEAFQNVRELINLYGNDVCLSGNECLSIPFGSNYCAIFVAVGAKLEDRN